MDALSKVYKSIAKNKALEKGQANLFLIEQRLFKEVADDENNKSG